MYDSDTSSRRLGGIRVGAGLNVTPNGVVSTVESDLSEENILAHVMLSPGGHTYKSDKLNISTPISVFYNGQKLTRKTTGTPGDYIRNHPLVGQSSLVFLMDFNTTDELILQWGREAALFHPAVMLVDDFPEAMQHSLDFLDTVFIFNED